MKYFETPVKISLSETDFAKATHFSNAVVDTVNYHDSLQFNRNKIRDDHFVSKLGEEAVRQAFAAFQVEVQGPDYTIYNGKRKSWDSDLYVNGIALAVKTQRKSAAERYGLSWTFQKSSFRTDPILQKPEAWVCFVEFNDFTKQPDFTVFPPFQIKDLPFKAPRLARLVDKKIAVYAEDFL
jgi:hypothetical protein